MRGAALLLLALAGCSGQEMADQPSLKRDEANAIWGTASATRPLPEGVVLRGTKARLAAVATPPPVTAELMALGQRRFAEICAPCHGLAGDGDGIVVERGFSPPPSYHSARLRAADAKHFVDVIGNGYGAMYSYGDRVPPEERWAITAYIRALQLSRQATLADAPEAAERIR
ncbi:c-type cytochrome [Aureimonas leprariae]|uniref:Cytochrome c n=1 Tax=Plantimonas leprariae TaxID=2615207 RepID=A0A7V7PTC7_9HYPH|nr:cytochrome c [Aureimonas leprariae]KAB0682975.1 cytochrome c [Aureimonas leprariae]